MAMPAGNPCPGFKGWSCVGLHAKSHGALLRERVAYDIDLRLAVVAAGASQAGQAPLPTPDLIAEDAVGGAGQRQHPHSGQLDQVGRRHVFVFTYARENCKYIFATRAKALPSNFRISDLGCKSSSPCCPRRSCSTPSAATGRSSRPQGPRRAPGPG